MLFLDPHTQGVLYAEGQKCNTCLQWKQLEHAFYPLAQECKKCYDRKWMLRNDDKTKWPLKRLLQPVCQRANRRSRFRKSSGNYIDYSEVESLWNQCNGHCTHCQQKLTFNWHPRETNDAYAVLDRVDTTSNRTYASNSQFLCYGCNTEKGAWDLVDQLTTTIQSQKRKIKALKRTVKKMKRSHNISYASILLKS